MPKFFCSFACLSESSGVKNLLSVPGIRINVLVFKFTLNFLIILRAAFFVIQ